MSYRVQHVTFTKYVKDGEDILHEARIITYVDIKKTRSKLISLLTNDMEMPIEEIVEIYRNCNSSEHILGAFRETLQLYHLNIHLLLSHSAQNNYTRYIPTNLILITRLQFHEPKQTIFSIQESKFTLPMFQIFLYICIVL